MSQQPPWGPQGDNQPQGGYGQNQPGGYPSGGQGYGGYPPQGQGGYPPQGQGGYPPQGQGGYPPQGQGGYPPQGQGGYPPQGQGGYPPQGQGGYPPQGQGGYPPQGQGGYPPQGQGGYPPQGQGGYGQRPPGPPKKKSNLVIIGIVVAAVVLLAAVGGIIIALNRGGNDPVTTITPSQPTDVPTDEPTTTAPTDEPTTADPTDEPTTSAPTTEPTTKPSQPTGKGIDIGNGVQLTPAEDWDVKKKTKNAAQLTNGQEIFLGQSASIDADTNPGQLCTAWHKQVAESASSGKFSDPKSVDLNTSKLKAASCSAQITVSSGQGSSAVLLVSIVSVRQSDGVTAVGTLYFSNGSDVDQLDDDFGVMMNSMVRSQVS